MSIRRKNSTCSFSSSYPRSTNSRILYTKFKTLTRKYPHFIFPHRTNLHNKPPNTRMSQSSISQPSQGTSRTYVPPPRRPQNPASANPTGYRGDPITRVCRVVFRNPDQELITVQECDGRGDLPDEGPTMDLYDDPGKNEGRPWYPGRSIVDMTFYPTGGNNYGNDWVRRQDS